MHTASRIIRRLASSAEKMASDEEAKKNTERKKSQ
jgi:hypothetical protein